MESNTFRKSSDTYEKSWSENDPTKRMQMLKEALSPDCVYTDPNVVLVGYEALEGYMVELQANIPGVAFETTAFQTHHNRSLNHWNMLDGQGKLLGDGASHFVYGTDGRLTHMTGFFDQPSA
jgi:hypothetical protein